MDANNTFKLRNSKILAIADALANLEWIPGFISSDGKEVKKAFAFTGPVRLKIIQNIAACREVKEDLETLKKSVIKSLTADSGADLTPEQNRDFSKQMNDALDQTRDVHLETIPVYGNYTGDDPHVICLNRFPLTNEIASQLFGNVLQLQQNSTPAINK